MCSSTRSVSALAKLPHGALAVFFVLSACKGNHSQMGSADVTVRSLGALDVASVVATVSGPSLPTPETFQLTRRGGVAASDSWGAVLGSIPVGSNYVFTVTAVDDSNVTNYAGAVSGVTISAGTVTTVTIIAQQTTAPAPFSDAVPVIDSVVFSSTEIAPGDTTTIKATAHDADAGEAITFTWSASPASGVFSAPSAASTTWTAPNSEGDQTLVLTVTDSQGSSTSVSTVVHVSAAYARGQSSLTVDLNSWPVVTGVSASPAYLVPGSPTLMTVLASDADGDVLTAAWTSTCSSGSFANAAATSTSFTLPAGTGDLTCNFLVTVSDGRGGWTTGQTTLPVGQPTVISAPVITGSLESADTVVAGASVHFSVDATDPQGAALTFRWSSATGVISNQVDGANTSQILWTAPATLAQTFTVSVIVTDADAASTQFDFSIAGTCECNGTGPSGAAVTASCGQSACGSDNTLYSCSASGWSATGQPCGALDAGACECNGTGPSGAAVTASCGQSACGSDNTLYSCSASGWSATGSACP